MYGSHYTFNIFMEANMMFHHVKGRRGEWRN